MGCPYSEFDISNYIKTGDGSSSDNNEGSSVGDPESDDDDQQTQDQLVEVLLATYSDADRLNPGETRDDIYNLGDYTDPSIQFVRQITNDGFGSGGFRWSLWDDDGLFWSVIDNGVGSTSTIHTNFDDDGLLTVRMENNFDTIVSYSYSVNVYGYV